MNSEEVHKEELKKEQLIKQKLTKKALERYGNIKTVNPELAQKLITLISHPKITKIDNENFKTLLTKINTKRKIKIVRK